jgi:hypothetical protein
LGRRDDLFFCADPNLVEAMAVSSPVRRLGNTDAAMQGAPRRSAGSRSIVTPANSGPDIEGARGDFAAMEADVVQGAVVKRTQLRDGATRRHPLGEARECPSGAARHQAGYEVGRSHGAGAPGKRDGEFGHVDPPEYCCAAANTRDPMEAFGSKL